MFNKNGRKHRRKEELEITANIFEESTERYVWYWVNNKLEVMMQP